MWPVQGSVGIEALAPGVVTDGVPTVPTLKGSPVMRDYISLQVACYDR